MLKHILILCYLECADHQVTWLHFKKKTHLFYGILLAESYICSQITYSVQKKILLGTLSPPSVLNQLNTVETRVRP